MKTKQILINILLMICVLLIIIFIMFLILNQMEEKINRECEKINYEGIVSFWDADINCFQFSNLSNITSYNLDVPIGKVGE